MSNRLEEGTDGEKISLILRCQLYTDSIQLHQCEEIFTGCRNFSRRKHWFGPKLFAFGRVMMP